MDRLESTVLEIARHALDKQEEAMTELRARTGTLLTAASLIASFLGGQMLRANGLTVWTAPALAAFGVSVCLSIYVLLPKEGLTFTLDAPATYFALYEIHDDPAEVDRRLAFWLQSFREGNQPTIEQMTRVFELAGAALLIEILLLTTSIALS